MKICVAGLWHLGSVTAACLADAGHDVTGFDFDTDLVRRLEAGEPPVLEPGLADLVKAGLASGRLRFVEKPALALNSAEVVWVTYDTPVDDGDKANVQWVKDQVEKLFPQIADGAVVLISSQLPVGTTRALGQTFAAQAGGRRAAFAYSPENLRLGDAIARFRNPDRVVAGARSDKTRATITLMLKPITDRIEWMSVESAEMTKHAINGFLATSVTFANEVAVICEQVGADASEVERGLKSDARIGPQAYLSPGAAFAGGTLARDVVFLAELGKAHKVPAELLTAVKSSNDRHRTWAQNKIDQAVKNLSGATVAVWGLTYKPGTDTLRGSSAIELCYWLADRGARVHAHDPVVEKSSLPEDLAERITLVHTSLAAVDGAAALVVCTPWPEYRNVPAADVVPRMARPLVLDAARFTAGTLGADKAITYVSVGRTSA